MESQGLVKLFGLSEADAEGSVGAGLEPLVPDLLGHAQLLLVDADRLFHLGHLAEDVAHVAEGTVPRLVVFHDLGNSCKKGSGKNVL